MNPVLSVVTGTRNRTESFVRLLHSVMEHTRVPFELIVADASDAPYAGTIPDNVTIIAERPRLGHTRGYNQCFRAAKGEFCLWLNDDAEVLPDYAANAIRFMQNHPQIGLGALSYSENGGPFHVNASWGVIYANFGIFRKTLGDRVGFFDEDIEMYGADNSITFRILLAGKGVAAIPDAKILHHSVNDIERRENQRNRIRDNDVLTQKYIPLKHQWLSAFKSHHVDNMKPWPHGVEPR